MSYRYIVGIDPSGGPKPIAIAAFYIDLNQWCVSSAGLWDMEWPAVKNSLCLVAIEGGFQTQSPASLALQFQRGQLHAIARMRGFHVMKLVAPKSWRKMLTGSGNSTPKQDREHAEKLTGLTGLSADEIAAVGIAHYAHQAVTVGLDLELIA